jgi:N,N'-diacetylchitobiose transport system permease protein
VLGAFGPAGERGAAGSGFRSLSPSPDSFRRVFRQREFGRYFPEFLLAASSVVIVRALIGFLSATAARPFRFRFRTTPPIMFPAARTMPVEAPAIPLFSLPFFTPRHFGRPNTPGLRTSPRGAFSPPFVIRLPRGSADAVRDAPEAVAYLDGTSRARFHRRTHFPLVLTVATAAGMFSFLPAGNDFPLRETFFPDGVQRSPRGRSSSSSVSRCGPTGRYGGHLRGGDDSRADLLRTRTPVTRLRPRRR